MRTRRAMPVVLVWATACAAAAGGADEFRIKREAVYAFAAKPRVERTGDRAVIRFATKGYCDVTVAVEDAAGRIVRHLACGVLGDNAPPPLQKGSKRQTVVWDGKDDRGQYVKDPDACTVRVSLGLKPRFERTLFWSPHKRVSDYPPLIQATPEGVYVSEGMGADHLRLFDHDGNYMRTVYPFPADKLDQVKGLAWHVFPQDGRRLPLKADQRFYQCTLLSSGDNVGGRVTYPPKPPRHGLSGRAAAAMAVRNRWIALAHYRLNRLRTDGTTGGLTLTGPRTSVPQTYKALIGRYWRPRPFPVMPKSIVFSPDGKWLYLAGYTWDRIVDDPWYHRWHCLHGVLRMRFDADNGPEVFVGNTKEDGFGTDDRHFRCATSVDVDAKGRVYVSDYENERIQVYSPEGKHLKTIRVDYPVQVKVHRRTGEIYVFSWMLANQLMKVRGRKYPAKMTRFGPLERPAKLATCAIRFNNYVDFPNSNFKGYGNGHYYRVEVDSWSDPPTIWLVPGRAHAPRLGKGYKQANVGWRKSAIRLLVEQDGKLVTTKDFSAGAQKAVARLEPPTFSRQRLYVNERTGKLYLAEDLGFSKSFMELVEIDAETGKVRLVPLPFDAEDMAFDLDGLAYLRTRLVVGRYDPRSWREVPWDYGEERDKVGNGGGKTAPVASALALHSATLWHHGGMSVSARGHLVVACTTSGKDFSERKQERKVPQEGRPYKPRLFPGRVVWKKGAVLHIWDRHGRLVRDDVLPGLSNIDGVFIDRDDNVYVMTAQQRLLDGKSYFNKATGTLMKFKPCAGRILSSADRARIPLPGPDKPKSPPDLWDYAVGPAWAQGADWLYGGVGISVTKTSQCACSNTRFALDYFARCFAPEVGHYSVAVLDAGGNLIVRVGRYGNVDDGLPLEKDGGPPAPRSIGGDEVGLFYGAYVATHTDRRLFVADPGNARIVSVKLGYHASEKIALTDVPKGGAE